MEIFNLDKYSKMMGDTQATQLYVSECFPVGSTVTITEDNFGTGYYTKDTLEVIGYRVGMLNYEVLLVCDRVLTGESNPFIHPANVKLSDKYIRNIQLDKIFKCIDHVQ
jgi:hypothetical protein